MKFSQKILASCHDNPDRVPSRIVTGRPKRVSQNNFRPGRTPYRLNLPIVR